MVTTCGDIIRDAYRMAGRLDGDDELLPSQYAKAMTRLQALILAMPGMQSWIEVDADADYTAGEDERVRVITQDDITIIVPSVVSSSRRVLWCCNQITLACEGYDDRAPRDGSKIHLADRFSDSAATYFFRADIAQWTPALGLTKDSEVPFNANMDRYLAAMLANDMWLDLHPKYTALAEDGRQIARARYSQRKAVGTRFIRLSASRAT